MGAAAIFGKLETGGVIVGVDPILIEHATIVNRAIHTLNHIKANTDMEMESISGLFADQSLEDLRRLLEYYVSQGVQVKDLEL